jgi:hypothetical protein
VATTDIAEFHIQGLQMAYRFLEVEDESLATVPFARGDVVEGELRSRTLDG